MRNVSGRYYVTQNYISQIRCYYNETYHYICGNEVVAARLVIQFESLDLSDVGEYTCVLNITDGNYSRTITNRTREVFNIQGIV